MTQFPFYSSLNSKKATIFKQYRMNWSRNEHLLTSKLSINIQSFGFVSKGNVNRPDKILRFIEN